MNTETEWDTTVAQDRDLWKLDGEQHSRYCFARNWGRTHKQAMKIALDDTGRLFTELMEKTFG